VCGFAVCFAASAIFVFTAQHAEARSWSVTGRGGRTYSRTITPYTNGDGNFGRTITATRPNGQTATRSFNRSVSDGTITDSRTITGFHGQTASSALSRTPGQGRTATYTDPGGQTYTRSVTHSTNGDGNFGRTLTTNGPAGTTTRTFSQTNNGDGTYT